MHEKLVADLKKKLKNLLFWGLFLLNEKKKIFFYSISLLQLNFVIMRVLMMTRRIKIVLNNYNLYVY